jgi:hypothetical protein
MNIVKQPAAWIPILMSLGALATVVIHVSLFGAAPERDEGTAAHIWQLLMAGQLPVIAFYAFKWVPRTPKRAFCVLGTQAVAALTAMAPVYYLGL